MKDLTELKSKRKLREKHFLNKDGTITAYLYNNDIHYLKNGEYIDIDNTLIKEEYYYKNKENAFNTYFKYKNIDNEIIKIEKEEYYLNINLKNKIKPIIGKTRNNGMKYNNILNNIDLKYELIQNKIKESIILNKNTSDDITFILDTNLKIDLKEDKTIELKEEDTIFIIDAPYMFDSDNNYNYNIYYRLNNNELTLVLDYDWLKEAVYPVTIDPTITTRTESNSVYDTYIYQGDTNVNRNNQDILKIGTYRENGVDTTYRTLLKFDLPTIGTGSEVIHAEAVLTSHVSSIADWTKDSMVVDSNMLTSDWNETTANWNNMNNNYNARIDGVSYFNGSIYLGQTINLTNNYVNITNMVKKWYSGTPNYGLILKANKEEYQLDCNKANCYSKSHNLTELDPTPFLAITYRNQNGIESYMTYQNQSFTDGINYVNNYNGNLTSIFDIGRTISGKFPVSLNIVYNTNDVVLNNNFGYGIGYKLNLHQTVKGVTIEEQSLLEYIDEDGTIHYFKKKTEEIYNEHGVEIIEVGDDYYDEDGLGLTLLKDNNNYIMKDKNNNQYLFILNNNTWYLKEIIDTNSNQVIISYDINNRINSVVDANNEKINITYNTNQIIIVSPNETVYLNYDNNKIISITTKKGKTTFTYNNYNIIETITDTNGKKMKYEYYNVSPYRVKKIVEYGTNDSIGTYLEYYYGFQTTTVTDNKISHTTYTFNTFGNTVSTSNLNANEEVKHAYGKVDVYGWYKSETNKIVNDNSRFQYVNNYLKNTSFEQNTLDFTSSSNINALISEDECRTGTRSLKLTNTVNNEYVSQELEVTKGYYYTFSAYIKNNNNLRLKLSYADSNNQIVTEHTPLITVNNNFNRYDVTIYYKEEAISNLTITIYSETIGTVYIDDIQLEEGELANYYNLIYNSNFSDGINEWNIIAHPYNALSEDDTINPNYNIITLSNNQKSLVLNSDPYYGQTVEKTFNIKGKQGDSYTISFWYKNLGVLSTNETYQSYITGIILTFKYNDTSTGHGESITGPLNINVNINIFHKPL